jgi:uncharacterized protein with FMN-binding domain
MIRTGAAPRPIRIGLATVGIAGALALSGCAESDATATTDTTDPDGAATTAPDSDSTSSGDGSYADGSYTAEGSYATPESVETIVVTVTLADDVITDVEVTGDPQKSESVQYQGQFIGGIADVVVGQDIDEISVSRVAGSSLTSGGFNDAIEAITSEAAA